MSKILDFQRFKLIIEIIQKFDEKRERIDKFFEEELMENSFCLLTVGDTLHSTLISMLADEFNCWYSLTQEKPTRWWKNEKRYGISNEIEWWLYESDDKKVTVNSKEYDLSTIGAFYDYLIENYYIKGSDVEFSEDAHPTMSEDERIEVIKNLFNIQI